MLMNTKDKSEPEQTINTRCKSKMINITPLTIALLIIIAACAALWLIAQAWRWFVAWCMEITE